MKAVVVENYDSIDGISIREMELPRVSSGEVRVKIGAAAIGFVDGLKVQGLYQTKDPLPFVPGTEFAGVVDAVADNVGAFKPGMSVIGMTRSGGLAEYISVPSAALKSLPAQVPFEAGASFQANYLTGLYALNDRTYLRGQMAAYAACDDPDICAAVRNGFGDLVAYAERVSGAEPARVATFFAAGMLMNVLSSMGLQEPTEPWAQRLLEGVKQAC